MAAPATHSQPSRKGKKAWRKNVDLSEVQQGLDTVRDEVIAGGVIKEKGSDELFATDTTGDAEIAKRSQSGKKLLKAEEILALRSAVPGLDGRKRKAEDRIVPSSSKRVKNGTYVPHKELQRLKNVADGGNGGVLVDENAALHDPWAEPVNTKDPRLSFLNEAKPKREPKTLKEAPISLAAGGKLVQAVSKPHAGKSYNPLVGDWSALIEREGAAAVSAEEERLIVQAEAEAKISRAEEEAAKVEAQEREQYATDYDSAWESEWDGLSENEQQVYTHKQASRKTPTERNKLKARKERERAELHERKMKQREAQEKKIKQIAKEVSAKDKARQAHAMALRNTNDSDADSDDDEDVQLQRRRHGKLAVPQAPLEVVLPDELEDSLRRLKPEGNLMQERYRNLLISGKMEVRRKQFQRKRAKKTVSEKWSYKDWKLK